MTMHHILHADPPWKYGAWSGTPYGEGSRTADSHYSTLTLAELKAMRPIVDSMVSKDAIMFLWVTAPFLVEGLALCSAWGFLYKTIGFSWVKMTKDGARPRVGLGHYTRGNVELCLIARRGQSLQRRSRSVSQVIMAPIGRHSAKPEETYSRIEELYAGPYLDMFARQAREGWTVWGDEV